MPQIVGHGMDVNMKNQYFFSRRAEDTKKKKKL